MRFTPPRCGFASIARFPEALPPGYTPTAPLVLFSAFATNNAYASPEAHSAVTRAISSNTSSELVRVRFKTLKL